MKVLFVNDFKAPDYLNDMIYHGLCSLCGVTVYETSYPSYMMKTYPSKELLYGRGFTIFGKMKHTVNLEIEKSIIEKISSKFYDFIVYGSIARCSHFFELVTACYDKTKIAFLDGEDEEDLSNIFFLNKGHYFKREIIEPIEGVMPISFSVPESCVVKQTPDKEKIIADVGVTFIKQYSFDNEDDYHNEYRRSYFGYTAKKAGWDCLRHYEILANGCVPIFENIENCPETVMTSLPKTLLTQAKKYFYLEAKPDEKFYRDFTQVLIDHTAKNCTTRAEAKKLLERIAA